MGQAPGTGAGTGSGTAGGTDRGAASDRVPTAADIAADQAAIDAAEAKVSVAKHQRSQGVLTTPMAGTVAAVAVSVGERVSAGSTTSVVTVIGETQYQVTTTVPLSLIDAVKVGQPAAVTVNGITAPVPGAVSMIGLLNSSTGSTASYPVTVTLRQPAGTKLYDGTGAGVAVTVGDVSGVLTVPTSAVHATASGYAVGVLRDGAAVDVPVEIGAVGTTLTEITSGLQAGDQVVLADLSAAIPTATARAFGARPGGGALGGGGLGGGGLGGGGLGGGTGFGGGAQFSGVRPGG